MSEKIMKYTVDDEEVTLSPSIVRTVVCDNPEVTEQEVRQFMALCYYQRLNPFIREAYLVKYGSNPATMVVGKDVFVKRAFRNPSFRGYEAGVTVIDREGRIERRQGSMAGGSTERLIGGWCRVYIDGFEVPMFDEVSFAEYAGKKRDGSLNKQWARMPGTMIRKVAIVHALREAFPESLQGLYDASEMGVDDQVEAPEDEGAGVSMEDVDPGVRERYEQARRKYEEEF